jgi:hypothetical protein
VTRVRVRGGVAPGPRSIRFIQRFFRRFAKKGRLQPLILAGMFNEILPKLYVFA